MLFILSLFPLVNVEFLSCFLEHFSQILYKPALAFVIPSKAWALLPSHRYSMATRNCVALVVATTPDSYD